MNANEYLHQRLNQGHGKDKSREAIISPQSGSKIHGYGEIIWVKNGELVGLEKIFQVHNVETLEEKTLQLC